MKFKSFLKAGYSILYCQNLEEDRTIDTLRIESGGCLCFSWDCIQGVKDLQSGTVQQIKNALQALQFALTMPEDSILFLKDFHKYIETTEIFRTLKNIKSHLEAHGIHIVIVSPVLKIPVELQKDIYLIDLPLPDLTELMKVARWALEQFKRDNPEIDTSKIEVNETTIRNAVGLTLIEAKNVFARSLVETLSFDKSIIETEKLQAVKKSGLCEIEQPVPTSEIGGLEEILNYFIPRKLAMNNPELPVLKGILATGLPGTGKSLIGKAVASIFKLPLLSVNFSNLKDSLVGGTEKKMREFFQLADAMSPCVIRIDEIEKSLGGAQSSNRTDGGTGSAQFGALLTWMEDSKHFHYIVASCNDIDELLRISQGALLRRFDDVFFFDMPSLKERIEILKIMNRRYKTSIDESLAEKMNNWTGAEIEKFVRSSIYDGVEVAFKNIHPVYLQNKEAIDRAREWAKNNARPANSQNGQIETKERRVRA